jgi:hypothetical protein
MNRLREKMQQFQRDNAEERLIYQVMDLELIKYRGVQSGVIVPGDKIYQSIEKCIEGFIWLYENGYSLEKSLKDKLQEEQEKLYYQEFIQAFSTFNEFMKNHMQLVE